MPEPAGDYASKVSPYLPTGTLLFFQTFVQSILPTDGKGCSIGQRIGTAVFLGFVCFMCALLSWTDSYTVNGDGANDKPKVVYVLVLPECLGGRRKLFEWFHKLEDDENQDVERWNCAKDCATALLSTGAMATLGLLTAPLSNCYFPRLDASIPRAVPPIVVGTAVVLFGFFDNGRDGLGFNKFMPSKAADGEGGEGGNDVQPRVDGAGGSGTEVNGAGGSGTVRADGERVPGTREAGTSAAPAPPRGGLGGLWDKLWVNKGEKIGNWASQAASFLPTGSLLTLQTTMQLILPTTTDAGASDTAAAATYTTTEKALAIIWLVIMSVLCFLLTWTDSGVIQEAAPGAAPDGAAAAAAGTAAAGGAAAAAAGGAAASAGQHRAAGQKRTAYVFVYPRLPFCCPSAEGQYPSKPKVKVEFNYKDVVDAVLSTGTLVTLGLLSQPMASAVLGSKVPTLAIQLAPPLVVAFSLFCLKVLKLDNGRNGLGFNPPSNVPPPKGENYLTKAIKAAATMGKSMLRRAAQEARRESEMAHMA